MSAQMHGWFYIHMAKTWQSTLLDLDINTHLHTTSLTQQVAKPNRPPRQTLCLCAKHPSYPASHLPTFWLDREGRCLTMDDTDPPTGTELHIEVLVHMLPADRSALESAISNWLLENLAAVLTEDEIVGFDDCSELYGVVRRMVLTEASVASRTSRTRRENVEMAYLEGATINLHIYSFRTEVPMLNPTRSSGDDDDDGGLSWIPSSRITELPAEELDGLWDGLIYESNIKNKLLGYLQTLVRFSRGRISLSDVSFNRVVLLHGPPGSGKTSLARGMAQKLSIRFSGRYRRFQLLEINGSSLFSKYYSESGKIVARMFDWILGLAADPTMFAVILIDEIETLIASRQTSGEEARESLRVVNALLTGLDKLLAKSNVLILTTSNIVQIMDPAFLDRVDLNELVDAPHIPAAYTILRNCLSKMVDGGGPPPTSHDRDYTSLRPHQHLDHKLQTATADLADVSDPDIYIHQQPALLTMSSNAPNSRGKLSRIVICNSDADDSRV